MLKYLKLNYTKDLRLGQLLLSGVSGLVAACLQPYWVEPQQIGMFVNFWVFIAIVNVMFISGILGYRYLYLENDWERAKTRNMLMQFGPCLFAGALVTFSI